VYGGKLTRYRHSTKEVQDVSPAPLRGTYRFLRTAPVVFSHVDPRLLFYAGNVVFRTADGGRHWDVISPDLSRETTAVPESIGVFRTKDLEAMKRRGVVYTLAPAYRDVNVIWAGTDDGLIHRTADGGKTWADVTPPSLTAWSKVSMLEASPHRRPDRVRRDQPPPPRRPETARPEDSRRRKVVGRGRERPARTTPSTPSAKIRCGRAFSTPRPSAWSASRSTTGRTGSRCASTCRRRRCATSSSRATTS
jgi:hypothetical protein